MAYGASVRPDRNPRGQTISNRRLSWWVMSMSRHAEVSRSTTRSIEVATTPISIATRIDEGSISWALKASHNALDVHRAPTTMPMSEQTRAMEAPCGAGAFQP